jgi:hypothetical protein
MLFGPAAGQLRLRFGVSEYTGTYVTCIQTLGFLQKLSLDKLISIDFFPQYKLEGSNISIYVCYISVSIDIKIQFRPSVLLKLKEVI